MTQGLSKEAYSFIANSSAVHVKGMAVTNPVNLSGQPGHEVNLLPGLIA